MAKFENRVIASWFILYFLFLIYQSLSGSIYFDPEFVTDDFFLSGISFSYTIPRLVLWAVLFFVCYQSNQSIYPRLKKQAGYGHVLPVAIGYALLIWFGFIVLFLNTISFHIDRPIHFINANLRSASLAFIFTIIFSLCLATYLLLKIQWEKLHHHYAGSLKQVILKEVTVAMYLWAAISLALVFFPGGRAGAAQAAVSGPLLLCIAYFFFFLYWLIPRWRAARRRWRLFLIFLVSAVLVDTPLMMLLFNRHEEVGVTIFFMLQAAKILLIWPMARYYYDSDKEKKGKILRLQTAVSSTSANLDFLRSQINPHFLFNALNTIYGTALQENAERTAEGVQKLGDMMRFMLNENQHAKIQLQEEITYLQHYIDLQKLRTEQSPDIEINFTVHELPCAHEIAPMLLIPFVENAFKHGISLREKSWIRISLSCDTDHVYFDVHNSIHRKTEEDPEKDRSGIGLENVKQRLSLLYPQQHELNIRQTSNEFFIHLTIHTAAEQS